jgi:hypothetical protein
MHFIMPGSVHSDLRIALPVCLGGENPNRLVSLWDMYQVAAQNLVYIGRVLQALQSNPVALVTPQVPLDDGPLQQFLDHLNGIKAHCDEIKLDCTSDLVAWTLTEYTTKAHTHGQARSTVEYLATTFEQELGRRFFSYVEPDQAKYFRTMDQFFTDPPFGKDVMVSFQTAIRDTALAGNCLACGLNDACVFHLMRVLEKGLEALAIEFSEPFASSNWQNVIERLESKIRKIDSSLGPDWKEKQTVYSEIATQFMFFKDAWRNHVMHGRTEYDWDRAKNIYEHVRVFMQHLAVNGLRGKALA